MFLKIHKTFKPSSNFRTDRFKAILLLWILFHACICHTVLSVPGSLVVICLERIGLLCPMFSCVF